MSFEIEQLLKRCEALEQNIAQSMRIDELEREIFRRDVKKLLKERTQRRREQLRCLAELDQITAALTRRIDTQAAGD